MVKVPSVVSNLAYVPGCTRSPLPVLRRPSGAAVVPVAPDSPRGPCNYRPGHLPWTRSVLIARAFEQSSRVVQQRTEEEPDVDVVPERVDVAERRVADAGR